MSARWVQQVPYQRFPTARVKGLSVWGRSPRNPTSLIVARILLLPCGASRSQTS